MKLKKEHSGSESEISEGHGDGHEIYNQAYYDEVNFSRPVPAPRRRLPPTPHRGQKDYRSPRLLPQIPADKHYPDYYDSDYTGLNFIYR